MNEITYQNKSALNENPEIADINKVKASDMNEIKSVVNTNSQTSSNNFGLGTNTWTSSGTYAIGDIVVYNDNTYKNLTGTNTSTTPDQDSTNWKVIPLIVDEYSTSTKNAYCCNETNTLFQGKGQVLWTNPNPTNSFAEQTINLDMSDYNYIEIYYRFYTGATGEQLGTKIPVGSSAKIINEIWIDGIGESIGMRMIDTNSSSVTFSNTSIVALSDGTLRTTNLANGTMIPTKVIGYKEV